MEKVIWSASALNDLKQIHDFIFKDSPKYALIMVESIFDQTDYLSKYPQIGRMVPEMENTSVREIIFKGYRIIYQIKASHVEIITVIHGSKLLK